MRTLPALTLAIALSVASVAPAGAQTETDVDVSILSIPTLITKGEVAELVLDTTDATDEIRVVIHSKLTREQYLDGTLTELAVGDTFSLDPESDQLRVSIAPSRSTDIDDDIDLVANLDPGLHQLSVAVNDEVVDRAHVLIRPDPAETRFPLAVSIGLFVDTEPVRQPDGSIVISDADRDALETLALAFELTPDAPLSVQLQPDLIEALATSDAPEDTALLGRLRAALTGRSVLSAPLVDIDEEAFATESIGLLAGALTSRGDAILAEHLAVSPNRTVARLDSTAAGAAIDLLRDLGAGHVVVDEDRLDRLSSDAFPNTLTQRFRMSGAGIGTIDAAQTDARLAERLGDWFARDQLFEELGILAMDDPEQTRGVILPIEWFGGLDVVELATTLSAIEFHPDLELVDLPSYFAQVSEARDGVEPLLRNHRSTPASDLGDYPVVLGETSRLLDSYELLLGASHPTITPLRHLLDASADRSFTATTRSAYLDEVSATVRSQFDVIEIPQDLSFSLTSRNATIPLVIENTGTEEVTVLLHFESDNRIELPDGADIEVPLQPGRNALEIEIHARSSGTSLLDITALTPDGAQELQSGSVRINSTALSGVGIIIAVVALAVLLIWWLRQILETRRSRKQGHVDGASDATSG